jgi:hypothetical protein
MQISLLAEFRNLTYTPRAFPERPKTIPELVDSGPLSFGDSYEENRGCASSTEARAPSDHR